jgi:hypothetical protein
MNPDPQERPWPALVSPGFIPTPERKSGRLWWVRIHPDAFWQVCESVGMNPDPQERPWPALVSPGFIPTPERKSGRLWWVRIHPDAVCQA